MPVSHKKKIVKKKRAPKVPKLDRSQTFPREYSLGREWSKMLHLGGFKIIAANHDDFEKAYTVALENPRGWFAFAHRNCFGDVTHLTVWPPKSARLFEVWNEKDMNSMFARVMEKQIFKEKPANEKS